MNASRLKTLFPWLVLMAGLLTTYLLQQWAMENARNDLSVKFEKQAAEMVRQLEQRLELQALVLRGTGGFISSSAHITAEEFEAYIRSLKLQKSNPGVLSVGFTLALKARRNDPRMAVWLQKVKRVVGDTSRIPGQQSATVFLERFVEGYKSNLIGHDAYANPVRRAAMDVARDLQEQALTGKQQLVIDAPRNERYGFIMYYPVYFHNALSDTLAERRKNLLGWVFSPFRADDLIASVLTTHGEGLRMALFASSTPDEGARLTMPPALSASQAEEHAGLVYARPLEYAGQRWFVRVRPLPSYRGHLEWNETYVVQIAGTIISLLLFLYVWTLSRSRTRAEAIATHMTQELRESEHRWQFAVEGQGDGLWDWDVRQNTVFYSKQWKEMLGYGETEIGNRVDEWQKRVHPDDMPQALAALSNALSGKIETYTNEHRLQCKDGSWKWILDRGMVVIRASDGHALRMIGTHTDITSRKLAESRIRRLTQLYQAISHVNQAIVRTRNERELCKEICRIVVEYGGMKMAWIGAPNRHDHFIGMIAAYGVSAHYMATHRLSYDSQDPLGQNTVAWAIHEGKPIWCQDILAEPVLAQWHQRAIEAGWRAVASLPLYRSSQIAGVLAFYAAEPDAFDEEVRNLLLEIGNNLSAALDNLAMEAEREQAEQALRESEARYSTLFADNSVVMLLTDPSDGHIVDANAQACRFYGWDIDTLRTMNIRDINMLPPDQLKPELLLAMKRQKQHFFFRHRRHRRAGGDERDVEVFAGPVHIGKKALILSSIHDITERRMAENALRESETLNTTILNSLSEHIALLDDNGVIVSVNHSWVRFANENGLEMSLQDWTGINYFETCSHAIGTAEDLQARSAMTGILDVLTGMTDRFEMEYPCHSDDEQRWFVMRVTRLQTRKAGVVMAHENITDRKLSEIDMVASHERLAELSRELIGAQEKERRNLARELHDELGQKFTTLNIKLHQMRNLLHGNLAEETWRSINDDVSALIERVRSMSGSLRPPALDHLGLEASIKQLIKSHFSNTGIEYVLEYAGLPKRLPDRMEITLYRIVQEAITNILRHALASRVIVEINGGENAEAIELIVRDNGRGFDTSRLNTVPQGRSGYGLIGMTERVRLLGGTIAVESATGKGTRITVLLPLKQ